MAPLWSLLLQAARWDLVLIPRWIPTEENGLADALSRHEWKKTANFAPKLTQKALSQKKTTIKTSLETLWSLGITTTQILTDKRLVIYGGDSAPPHAELTERQNAAIPSGAACTESSGPSQRTL